MSTTCKLNPKVREARAMRSAFLRNVSPPTLSTFANQAMWHAIFSKLNRTHRSSSLRGTAKQLVFTRGIRQMAQLA